MRVLVDGGAEIDVRDKQGYTPMIGAVGVLSYEKVLMLHQHGAAINVRNDSNLITSLMAAVTGEHMDLIDLCLKNGCSVHDRDKVGFLDHTYE